MRRVDGKRKSARATNRHRERHANCRIRPGNTNAAVLIYIESQFFVATAKSAPVVAIYGTKESFTGINQALSALRESARSSSMVRAYAVEA